MSYYDFIIRLAHDVISQWGHMVNLATTSASWFRNMSYLGSECELFRVKVCQMRLFHAFSHAQCLLWLLYHQSSGGADRSYKFHKFCPNFGYLGLKPNYDICVELCLWLAKVLHQNILSGIKWISFGNKWNRFPCVWVVCKYFGAVARY